MTMAFLVGTIGLVMSAFTASGVSASSTDPPCLDSVAEGTCPSKGASMLQTHVPASKMREEPKLRIVRYNNAVGKRSADAADVSGHGKDLSLLHIETIMATDAEVQKLKENPDILHVEDDSNDIHVFGQRVERLHGLLENEEVPYGINMVNAKDVPMSEEGDLIKVCVIDTGYDLGHPDLPGESHDVTGMKPSSYNGKWDVDGHGHGTHCAGTIGAVKGNGQGVVGVMDNPNTFRFVIGKGLQDNGGGSWAGVIEAINGCVELGAKVLSMSLGGSGKSATFEDAVDAAYNDNGVLIIAAAGNGGNSAYSYPASYKEVMSVAAVDSAKNRASFSQYNDQVEIAAPGVNVKSPASRTAGYLYESWSGTSMACPHVAGVAAKVWSNFKHCTNTQIRNVLLLTATEKDNCNNKLGYGIVDGQAAYNLLKEKGCSAGDVSWTAKGGCKQLESDPGTPPPTPEPTPAPTPPHQC